MRTSRKKGKQDRQGIYLEVQKQAADWDLDSLLKELNLRSLHQLKERVLFNMLRNIYAKQNPDDDELSVMYYQEAMFRLAEREENKVRDTARE